MRVVCIDTPWQARPPHALQGRGSQSDDHEGNGVPLELLQESELTSREVYAFPHAAGSRPAALTAADAVSEASTGLCSDRSLGTSAARDRYRGRGVDHPERLGIASYGFPLLR